MKGNQHMTQAERDHRCKKKSVKAKLGDNINVQGIIAVQESEMITERNEHNCKKFAKSGGAWDESHHPRTH